MKYQVIGGLAVAFALVWFLVGVSPERTTHREDFPEEKGGRAPAVVSEFSIAGAKLSHPAEIDESNTDRRFTRFQDGVSYWHHTVKLSKELHRQDHEVYRDLEIVDEILSGYRLVYKENPVGTDNEEFAAALAGENPKQVVFIDPGILVNGELLDRFGSPYVFHSLTAEVMGLRSRGPDGQLGTDDDIALDVSKIESELGLARE